MTAVSVHPFSVVYIIGCGNVGSALEAQFNRMNIPCEQHARGSVPSVPKHECGETLLFLAVPDAAVSGFLDRYREERSAGLRMVYFSAGTVHDRQQTFLLHPFAAVTADTDLSQVLCTLWGPDDSALLSFLRAAAVPYVHHNGLPGPGYHTAAVIIGNFLQFFAVSGCNILREEEFDDESVGRLVRQLVQSSLTSVSRNDVSGLTGPAARGDTPTLEREYAYLAEHHPDLAELYRAVSHKIRKVVEHGSVQ